MSGYVGGAAQIPQATTINDMSHPNLNTNIHNYSGFVGGASQIPQANAINDKSVPTQPQTSTVLQVTPEALPKFLRQMILMISLIPFDHAHQDLSGYVGGAARIPQANAINDKPHPNLTMHIAICQVTLEALCPNPTGKCK